MRIALLLSLLLVAAACERKKLPPPPVEQAPPVETPKQPEIKAPATVPEELRQLLEREWPAIERDGDAFMKKYKEWQTAKASGNTEALDSLTKEANALFERAAEAWAGITYWPDDAEDAKKITKETADACRNFLGSYNKKTKPWMDANKILKEFSTVK